MGSKVRTPNQPRSSCVHSTLLFLFFISRSCSQTDSLLSLDSRRRPWISKRLEPFRKDGFHQYALSLDSLRSRSHTPLTLRVLVFPQDFVHGQMGLANAQRTLNHVRTLAQFISQPEYRDVVTMFGILNEPFIPFVLFFSRYSSLSSSCLSSRSALTRVLDHFQNHRSCSCRELVY